MGETTSPASTKRTRRCDEQLIEKHCHRSKLFRHRQDIEESESTAKHGQTKHSKTAKTANLVPRTPFDVGDMVVFQNTIFVIQEVIHELATRGTAGLANANCIL